MDVERRPSFLVRPALVVPRELSDLHRPARVAAPWLTDACAPDGSVLPESADLEGQPERRLVVDDYSSQVMGDYHPAGGPLDG